MALIVCCPLVSALVSSQAQESGVAPAKSQAAKEQIVTMLKVQAAAWNRGDLEAFMDHYWRSKELTFSSGGKTTRGWQATADGYKRRYDDAEKMGQLTFSALEVYLLGQDAAYVLGNWQLARKEPVGGNFSLVVRRMEERWFIVHDHTSALPPATGD